ncbi:MAG: membrane protein insertase YidC [Verrucomicrobiota bacterium]|nr:membrane protein insertase YidC [Verrucomicrobiota bacterium]
MDKKNTILGLICILSAIGYMFWQAQAIEKQRLEQLQLAEESNASKANVASAVDPIIQPVVSDERSIASVGAGSGLVNELFKDTAAAELPSQKAKVMPEKTVSLANEYIEATFTTRGGAIREVNFLQTKRGERDDYVFNKNGLLPAMSLSYSSSDGQMREFALDYSIEKQTADSISFLIETADGILIRRTYRIAPTDSEAEPYIIEHSTMIKNGSSSAKSLPTVYFNLGTARRIMDDQLGASYLNVSYFNGEDVEFIPLKKLTGGSGFLGIGANSKTDEITKSDRIEWASVKNQFFASVLYSDDGPASDLSIYPVEISTDGNPGISGSAGYNFGGLEVGEVKSLDFQIYIGPKEFKRLQRLGNNQDLVMQFGFLGFFSKLLLAFMYGIHSFIPSWGWSIVIMTICIKLLFWPLTAKASRSQKRMAKIQGPMSELKEKYKDNPQKIQQETLKLFKEHQVNPVAGCLPMIIQMPIFLGLFYMLRTASELRHEPFLWVSDLSMPDTVTEIGGFPINLLPIIMGVTMFFQMSMMPVSPTADPMQQKIFKFLPFIFLVFLYNFSAGLVLYWTVQNILTIIQQKIINNRPDEPLVPVAAASSASRGKGGAPRTKPKRK